MLGFPILYLKAIRRIMLQLSGCYFKNILQMMPSSPSDSYSKTPPPRTLLRVQVEGLGVLGASLTLKALNLKVRLREGLGVLGASSTLKPPKLKVRLREGLGVLRAS